MTRDEAGLPLGWTEVELEEVADVSLGKMLDRAKHTRGTNLPYLRNINVRWGEFDLNDLLVMPFEDRELEVHSLRRGDLLVCEGGEPGRAAVWPGDHRAIKFQKALLRVRPRGGVDPRWIMHSLRHDSLTGHLEDYFTGTTIKHFPQAAVRSYRLRLPPLAEERRIVAKLGDLLARSRRAREALEAVAPLLENLRQSILAAAFRGDLTADWRAKNHNVEPAEGLLRVIQAARQAHWESGQLERFEKTGTVANDDGWKGGYAPPEEMLLGEELGELPETWCWATGADVVEPGAEIVYGIVQPGPEVPNGIPYVRGMDIENGMILEGQLKRTHPDIAKRYERASLRGGDVLLGIIRATKVAVVPSSLKGANITQGTARFRPAQGVESGFLAGVLAAPGSQNRLHAMYRGIDMPGLNLRDVRRLPVPLAPSEEQKIIASRVSHWMEQVGRLEASIRVARERHQHLDRAVLAKALRGELVPQDPNDEPASVLLERVRAERGASEAPSTESRRRSRAVSETRAENGDVRDTGPTASPVAKGGADRTVTGGALRKIKGTQTVASPKRRSAEV